MGASADDDGRAQPAALRPLAEEEAARLRRGLSRAVARVCPPWMAAQRDDIVQCAMMRVLEVLRRGEGDVQLAASYLWKVAYSATVDELRRLRRRREVSLDEDPRPAPVAAQADPEHGQADREVAQGLHDCLRLLLEPRRLAVTLHLLGHSVPQAARLLGWDAKRTENLVYRGLADLRGCLTAKGLKP